MKTFNEAFEELHNEDYSVMMANLEVSKDYMTNEKWVNLIHSIAIDSLKAIVKSNTETNVIAYICTELQLTFQLGVLTGIKMEKPNA